ncbi:MAG: GH3 auxin-responsive promoter family protein [Lachnospiraceae bacterium]|nr:GH3 auxin-responsive promoter family protein [Lachnospiraceae bacterium]
MEVSNIFKELKSNKYSFQTCNREVLMKILKDNKDSLIGKKYGFSDIGSMEEYREKVPVSSYKDYRDQVEAMLRGEENLICSYDIYSILTTSGSGGKRKYIPISLEALRSYGNVMDRYLQSHVKSCGGKRLFLSFLQTDLTEGTEAAKTMLFTAAYYRYLYENELIDINTLAGGREGNFFSQFCDYLYVKLWLAFASEDLTSIESVYLYDFLIFFRYMEDNYDTILNEMADGRVPERVNLPLSLRKWLESCRISKDRIHRIRKECSLGFENIVERLWPSVSLISGIGSKAFRSEEISLQKYIGNIPVWHYIFAASECLMAVPLKLDSYDLVLWPGSAYYEFLGEDGKPYDPKDMEEGQCYEICITNFSGLYRYAMGDIIKLKGYYGEIPVFRYVRRNNLVLNIAGEKTSMDLLDSAIRRLVEEKKIDLWEYGFYEDYTHLPASYHGLIAVEYPTEKDDELSIYFDEILKEASRDYCELRDLGSIDRAGLEFVDRDYFMKEKDETIGNFGHSKSHHIWRVK